MYDFSVIIPCFNCENTLPETLDCVLGQSLHERIQIIPVNDGSTDSTQAVIDRYAAEYGQITPVTKENGGVSSARNAGLAKVQGKYVIFLDADDLLTPGTCEALFDKMEKRKADCAVFRLSRFGFGGNEYNPAVDEIAECEEIAYNDKRLLWTFLVGNKCYTRESLEKTCAAFPPLAYCEDGVFWMTYLMRAKPTVTGVYGAECRYRREDPAVRASVTQTMKPSLVSDFITACEMILAVLEDGLVSEMQVKICRTITNEFYRRLWQADNGILKTLEENYNRYYALLSPENKKRVIDFDADIGVPVFSRIEAAAHPKISVIVKKPSADFLRSLYSQTMPLFEVVTGDAGEYEKYENVNHGSPKSKLKVSFSGSEKPDPRTLRAILLLSGRKPFSLLPSFLLKKAVSIYLR